MNNKAERIKLFLVTYLDGIMSKANDCTVETTDEGLELTFDDGSKVSIVISAKQAP